MVGPATTAMTAHQVRRAVYQHFHPRWAVLFEVTARPDASPGQEPAATARKDRRIDALVVRRSPRRTTARRAPRPPAADVPDGLFAAPPAAPPTSVRDLADDGGFERLAIEIKVSRADFWSDVRDPSKQQPWRELSDRHAYCAPKGLIRLDEIPAGSGLLEVSPSGLALWARRAPRVTAARPLPLNILLDAFYRWSRAEAVARGLDFRSGEQELDAATLRSDLARLTREKELLEGRLERAEDAADQWRRLYAASAPLPCGTCGKPLRPGRTRLGWGSGSDWAHEPEFEVPCRELRAAAAERDGLGWVPPAEPAQAWGGVNEPITRIAS